MKLIFVFTAALALAAGPALAQGTFNNGKKPATGFGAPASGPAAPSPYKPSYGQPPSAGRTPGAPSTMGEPAFKPYQGYKGGSVYSSKPSATPGAKPCETSVYVNACDKTR